MIFSLFDSNEKEISKLKKVVAQINNLEDEVKNASKDDFISQTKLWQEEFVEISPDKLKKKLDEILPKAFAMVRESARRTLNKRQRQSIKKRH